MDWIFLLIAGVFEIGWPLGFKLAETTGQRLLWISIAVLCMALSGGFLWYAQKTIPIGTAYAAWTGIGAVGTLLVGILIFGDSASVGRMLSALAIVTGVIGLKIAK
ncbi:MAG: hypothetical protein JSR44_15195 [Spirochaetes bacterium]|nr:hypothetical protein [Spirochaetota bacterium]